MDVGVWVEERAKGREKGVQGRWERARRCDGDGGGWCGGRREEGGGERGRVCVPPKVPHAEVTMSEATVSVRTGSPSSSCGATMTPTGRKLEFVGDSAQRRQTTAR